ncbi:hypothetical protein G6F66_015543 [Rhizopus arrhizus]|nr:hypothetical protein G6F66_015543 [Rhizopus arrhizus]
MCEVPRPATYLQADPLTAGGMAQAGAAGSGGCDQQAEAEDRATMGIDAGGRAQHRRFGGDAAPAQGIEVRPGCTE